jgi:predicted metal-dependent peptidase
MSIHSIPAGIRDADQYIRLTRARSFLVSTPALAFYGSTALRLRLVERADVETACVDGRTMFYNPAFVAGLTDGQVAFLFAHETRHCTDLHFIRMGGRDPETWNEATDHAINLDLLSVRGLEAIPGILADPSYRGMSAESIYAAIVAAKPKPDAPPAPDEGDQGDQGDDQGDQEGEGDDEGDQGDQGDQEGEGEGEGDQEGDQGEGEGEGEGDQEGEDDQGDQGDQGEGKGDQGDAVSRSRDPGRAGGVIAPQPDDDGESIDPATLAQEWAVYTHQAIAAATRAAGSLPGHLASVAAELSAPRIDWRTALRRFVDQSAIRRPSWTRPNRRYVASGMYLPGSESDSLAHLVFARDTSCSISDAILSAVTSEIDAAMGDGAADRITIIDCDSRIHRAAEFERGDILPREMHSGLGRGGTAFRPVFEHVRDAIPDASAVVYLTDLECTDIGEDPGVPVMWVTFGDPRQWKPWADRLPFGEVISIDDLA